VKEIFLLLLIIVSPPSLLLSKLKQENNIKKAPYTYSYTYSFHWRNKENPFLPQSNSPQRREKGKKLVPEKSLNNRNKKEKYPKNNLGMGGKHFFLE